MQAESRCLQLQEGAARREQELVSRVSSLEEVSLQAENQVKELKETIFELDDQVEQQRAVHLHTNQTVLDMESMCPLCPVAPGPPPLCRSERVCPAFQPGGRRS